jgi:hypothetical protein
MRQSPEDFDDLRSLLALKRHEQPPPGYFKYLPGKILVKIQRDDLSEHSTWWEWLVAKFDARPVLAGAYALAISGIMLMGLKLSQDLQNEGGSTFMGWMNDPVNSVANPRIANHFANPGNIYLLGTSTETVFEEPAKPVSHPSTFSVQPNLANTQDH